MVVRKCWWLECFECVKRRLHTAGKLWANEAHEARQGKIRIIHRDGKMAGEHSSMLMMHRPIYMEEDGSAVRVISLFARSLAEVEHG